MMRASASGLKASGAARNWQRGFEQTKCAQYVTASRPSTRSTVTVVPTWTNVRGAS